MEKKKVLGFIFGKKLHEDSPSQDIKKPEKAEKPPLIKFLENLKTKGVQKLMVMPIIEVEKLRNCKNTYIRRSSTLLYGVDMQDEPIAFDVVHENISGDSEQIKISHKDAIRSFITGVSVRRFVENYLDLPPEKVIMVCRKNNKTGNVSPEDVRSHMAEALRDKIKPYDLVKK